MTTEDTQTNPADSIVPSAPQPTFSAEDLEKTFQGRLDRERASAAKEKKELMNRIKELEKKTASGTATTSENLEYQNSVAAVNSAEKGVQDGSIPISQVNQYIQQQIEQKQFVANIHDAVQKDEEFKALVIKNAQMPKGQERINEAEAMLFSDLPNGAAVLKHFLKNDGDYRVFKAAEGNAQSDGGVRLLQFINEVSDRLLASSSSPQPSRFSPIPDVSDIGGSDDFDVAEYVSSKY